MEKKETPRRRWTRQVVGWGLGRLYARRELQDQLIHCRRGVYGGLAGLLADCAPPKLLRRPAGVRFSEGRPAD